MAGISGDEFVVAEGVSRFGLHRLHVLRAGRKVDREKWIREKVNGGTVEAVLEYEDEGVGMHHLRLYWRVIDAHGAKDGFDEGRTTKDEGRTTGDEERRSDEGRS